MATEEVTETIEVQAKQMVEVWASTVDALLQEWFAKGQANDRLGTAIASVKLAQIGLMLSAYFKDVGEEFIEGETELKACRQAVVQTHEALNNRMRDLRLGKPIPPAAGQDKTLN